MTKSNQVLQEHRELILGLGQVVTELFVRVLALEAVLQKRGALSPQDLHTMAQQMYKAIPSTRTSAGEQAELDSLEDQKQQALDRVRSLLLRFDGLRQ